jgi:hypothetical protein
LVTWEHCDHIYDGAIIKVRVQFVIDSDLKRRATERAGESGVSFAEYVVKLVERDMALSETKTGIEAIFDLGSSGGSNVAENKRAMIGEAIAARRLR